MILTHLVFFNFLHGASVGAGVPTPPPPVITRPGGVKRKPFRVRRSDFSSEENYKLALKAALAGASLAQAPVTDTVIKVSPKQLFKLQEAPKLDEKKLIAAFIKAIESEYE